MKRESEAALQTSLRDLAERYSLPEGAARRLAALLAALASDPRAPTAIRDPRRVLEDHLADSLVALEMAEVRGARTIADLGSGAGLPGIALAIALPRAQVCLVESNRAKTEFLHQTVEACGLDNTHVITARVEDWPDGLGRFELVTARALAPLPVVVEYAAPLLCTGGALLAWRGRRDPGEEGAAQRAASLVGLEPGAPRRVEPYAGARQRHLQLFVKTDPTPDRFPRRPGMARKRPLGN
ncbi:MAG: 16S rRNA (guanine(527)-N(7))-methyltransferase RsmG [Actinomycetota bacterium]|nr:16S rRNA (guanine(527)-N(7))-methyltransferase RsmG [Actinomycetota bacterium]